MPFTPFHFGLGLAAKAVAPRRFSLALFIALQVIIDLESLYNLVKHRYPVHTFLHTFVGATSLAFGSSIIVFSVIVCWQPKSRYTKRQRFAWLGALALFATWSHVILDGIMHQDAEPFWPFTTQNPLLALVRLNVLHLGLVILGVVGLIGIAIPLLTQRISRD